MLGFSQVLKPIKRQDLLENGKYGRKAFRTGAKIHFSEKIFWSLGHCKVPVEIGGRGGLHGPFEMSKIVG